MSAFTIIAFEHAFRGSTRPLGWRYCLRHKEDGLCLHHGLVFGPIENIRAELMPPMDQWEIPIEHGICPCHPRLTRLYRNGVLRPPTLRLFARLWDGLCLNCRYPKTIE